jgi:hypothetical protein
MHVYVVFEIVANTTIFPAPQCVEVFTPAGTRGARQAWAR